MSAEERAERIWKSNFRRTKGIQWIAAQITEACVEARKQVLDEQKCKVCGCSYERCCCNPVREMEARQEAASQCAYDLEAFCEIECPDCGKELDDKHEPDCDTGKHLEAWRKSKEE